MSEGLRSVLLGTVGLDVALGAALVLTLVRSPLRQDRAARDRAVRLLLFGIAAQCLHFVEEFVTGFHLRFPRLLGLSAWTPEFFVTFNVSWIAIWVVSVLALREGARAALFPAWFLALALVANGIAHPILSVAARGYFPGLVTSPLVGVVGVMLVARLLAVTGDPRVRGGSPSPAR